MENKQFVNRLLFVIILIINDLPSFSQQIYISKESSYIRFFSRAVLEDIAAVNKTSVAVLNTANNEIAIKINVRNFEFPNKLMQEHFNENYLETNRFPYTIFKGKISKAIDWKKSQNISVSVVGEMEMHGKQKMQIIDGRLTFDEKANVITLDATFKVLLADFDIAVPSVVFTKIAEKIEVNAQFSLFPINQKREISLKKSL